MEMINMVYVSFNQEIRKYEIVGVRGKFVSLGKFEDVNVDEVFDNYFDAVSYCKEHNLHFPVRVVHEDFDDVSIVSIDDEKENPTHNNEVQYFDVDDFEDDFEMIDVVEEFLEKYGFFVEGNHY